MKSIAFLALAPAALLLASCDNPADDTTSAEVRPAQSAPVGGGIKYLFDDASKVEFTGSKVTGSHDGGFESFDGFFLLAEGDEVPNSGKVVIDMKSTWSDNEKLTGHLTSNDFFAVDTYPESIFELTDINKTSDSAYKVSGNLKLHGVTKNISFPAMVEVAEETISIKAEFDINRKDFDINFPGKPDDLIRDEVVIRLALTATPE